VNDGNQIQITEITEILEMVSERRKTLFEKVKKGLGERLSEIKPEDCWCHSFRRTNYKGRFC